MLNSCNCTKFEAIRIIYSTNIYQYRMKCISARSMTVFLIFIFIIQPFLSSAETPRWVDSSHFQHKYKTIEGFSDGYAINHADLTVFTKDEGILLDYHLQETHEDANSGFAILKFTNPITSTSRSIVVDTHFVPPNPNTMYETSPILSGDLTVIKNEINSFNNLLTNSNHSFSNVVFEESYFEFSLYIQSSFTIDNLTYSINQYQTYDRSTGVLTFYEMNILTSSNTKLIENSKLIIEIVIQDNNEPSTIIGGIIIFLIFALTVSIAYFMFRKRRSYTKKIVEFGTPSRLRNIDPNTTPKDSVLWSNRPNINGRTLTCGSCKTKNQMNSMFCIECGTHLFR